MSRQAHGSVNSLVAPLSPLPALFWTWILNLVVVEWISLCFDILSHWMSVIGIYRQLTRLRSSGGSDYFLFADQASTPLAAPV